MIRFDSGPAALGGPRGRSACGRSSHTESARQQRHAAQGHVRGARGVRTRLRQVDSRLEDGPVPLPDSRSQEVVPDPAHDPGWTSAYSARQAEEPPIRTGPAPGRPSPAPPGLSVIGDPEGFQPRRPRMGAPHRGPGGGKQVVFYEEPGRSSQIQIFWVAGRRIRTSPLKLAEKNAKKNKNYEREALFDQPRQRRRQCRRPPRVHL